MSRRVAVIEDEFALRENYADVLRKQGYAVQTFANRKDAMAVFVQRLTDLAIIDIGLQEEVDGGFTLCRALRSMSETLPIIFLTARDSDVDTVSGLRIGADDYLTKPFRMEELVIKIRNTIETRRKLIQTIQNEPAKITVESQDDRFIKSVKLIIEGEISNPNFGMVDLASGLSISTSALQKKLKRICNKSVSQFIREYRLKRSRDLIDLGYGNLSEISAKAGFTSLSYFSKCFKTFFGVNPTEL